MKTGFVGIGIVLPSERMYFAPLGEELPEIRLEDHPGPSDEELAAIEAEELISY